MDKLTVKEVNDELKRLFCDVEQQLKMASYEDQLILIGQKLALKQVNEFIEKRNVHEHPPKHLIEILKNRDHLRDLFHFVTGKKLKNKKTDDNKRFTVMYSGRESEFDFFTLYFDGSILHQRDLRPGITYFDLVDKIRSLGYDIKPKQDEKH